MKKSSVEKIQAKISLTSVTSEDSSSCETLIPKESHMSFVGNFDNEKLTICESIEKFFNQLRYSVPSQNDFLDEYLQCSSSEEIITQEPGLSSNHQSNWITGGAFGSRCAVLLFKSSALASPTEASIQEKPGHKLHITYKVLQAETKLLSKLLECHGVREVAPNSSDFNLLWTGSHPKPGTLRSLAPHQRVNHFPRSFELTRKDRLFKNIERMQYLKGFKNFNFIPQTFVMPTEYRELCSAHHRIKGPWIVKPVASSRGRGIFIVENPNQVPLEEPVVVAKYISNPLLVAGHKCDLRLYVAVTSFDPLLVYIYEEGLVRFATVKYDTSHKQLWNPCMHLCNYSINKYHSDYVKSDDPSAENVGHKWTLSALLRHLKADGKDTALLMSQIEDVIIKAILACAHTIVTACKMFVPNPNNCFELFGFDILIDKNLKPWLLEVNLSPSLNCDSPLDVRLKSAMLSDLLSLVGIPAIDPVLRPCTVSTLPSKKPEQLKMKFSKCRRVHSADGLSTASSTRKATVDKNRSQPASIQLTAEEQRVVRNATSQFERRGGFIRIFPAADSWTKYVQYLDPTTGVPVCGTPTSNYSFNGTHNFNLLLHNYLFPEVPQSPARNTDKTSINQLMSGDNRKEQNHRQDRYERKLSQGHRSSLVPSKTLKESHSLELKKRVVDMLKNGKKITQCEARKTFSQYLACVLKKIVSDPDQEEFVDIVLKFLQRASNYLKTPFSVKAPSDNMDHKDRAAIVAKQLNDFLYLYNRETDVFVDKSEKPSQIPSKLFKEFLENAQECDLEEVLVYQTSQTTVPSYAMTKPGFPSILKCIPNVQKPNGLKPTYKVNKCKSLKISTAS